MRRVSIATLLGAFFFMALPLTVEAAGIRAINVHGVINAGTARYIARAIDAASASGDSLVMITLNTPGGLLNFTRDIVQKIDQSKVPVAVYVAPGGASATSAGTIIAMAAHSAGMAPGTNIGAAHPVGGQGEDIKGDMKAKAENDTVAFIRAQAQQRGRNADWAEQAIRKSVSATSEEALKLRVVDWLAPDLKAALLEVGKKYPNTVGLQVAEVPMTAAERFLMFIGDPNVSYMLMALGGLGIYVEVTSPGVVLPGLLGAISLILAFVSFSTLPVNYGAVALLALGFLMFGLEAFITSYGTLTIGGIISLVLGALLLMDSSTGDLRLSLALVLPTVLAVGLISACLGYLALKTRKSVYAGLDNFNGYEGTVQSIVEAGYNGKCLIRGELWDFESESTLHAGDRVLVVERKGLRLKVMREKGDH